MKKKSLLIGLIVLVIGFVIYQLIPKHNVFVRVGDMNVARSDAKAVLLNDGRVLILGGGDIGNAEIYNPKKKNFTLIGQTNITGADFTMTLLNNGEVLLVGGLKETYLFDPKTNTFIQSADLNYPRTNHTSTLLKDGRVLIAGGESRVPNSGINDLIVKYSEIYNPKTNKFEIGPKINIPRFDHNAILLDDGNVLIVGGITNKKQLASAEIYDFNLNKFIKINDMKHTRVKPQIEKLKNGEILIIGGYGLNKDISNGESEWIQTIEIYDPKISQFSNYIKNNLTDPSSIATLLSDGNVLFTAGARDVRWYSVPTNESAILNVPKTELIKGSDLKNKRCFHSAILLNDGTVLIIGGNLANEGRGALKSAELYIP